MTDTTPGGWTDAARPGVPLEPERGATAQWHDTKADEFGNCLLYTSDAADE